MRTYRAVIVEESEVVRERLVILLAGIEGLSVVAALESPEEAMGAICHLRPDAVILSIREGDPSVMALAIAFKRERPGMLVVALSNAPCAPCEQRFLAAGADLFLDKTGEFDQIGPALERAAEAKRRSSVPGPPI